VTASLTASPPRVIVLGALSAIAGAVCRLYAAEGASLLLAGRDETALREVAVDLTVRGAAKVEIAVLDLAEAAPEAEFPALVGRLGGVDHVLIAYGVLGDQRRAESDLAYARALLTVNFTSPALWALAAADALARQGSGALIVIGSVAGDRGRQSNFVYGAAKAGLATLVQGLAHRLAGAGARAVVVKPGFVDTPMTAHLPKKGPLWAKPERIAAIIRAAADGGGPIVYAPGFWRLILLAIRLAPARIFHRTKL
jgi:decaprenylphospho-beta-D-erythro-pentofuranosid-2-ulose 2-reductase